MIWLILLASLLVMSVCLYKILGYQEVLPVRPRLLFIITLWIWIMGWSTLFATQISNLIAGVS